ncbi:MAG: ATP-grasp domain-containing protein [Oligoflexia bacterium]|nr:ATP-grasp domain-containing protein [Oligoflexia bacterium]
MILLGRPYVSKILSGFIESGKVPFLVCDDIELTDITKTGLTEKSLKKPLPTRIYVNSENTLSHVYNIFKDTALLEKVASLKDKYEFRRKLKNSYPGFCFNKIKRQDLNPEYIANNEFNYPLVLKPVCGFFGMGVYIIRDKQDFVNVIKNISDETEELAGIYPEHVLSTGEFVVEDYIDGEEFAVDAFFNPEGKPVIINILNHPRLNSDDSGHRLYYTSPENISGLYNTVMNKLGEMSNTFNLCEIAGHIEFRITGDNRIYPVEFNPLRFAGWCATDIAYYAYGINPYNCYFNNIEPDWDKILNSKHKYKFYCINVADFPVKIQRSRIKSVDYARFESLFSEIFEIRKVDYNQYQLFAIALTATNDNKEIANVLNVDFSTYLHTCSSGC